MKHPKVLPGHPYWNKSVDELRYIIADAGEAAVNMRGFDPVAECKYLDQINDASTILKYKLEQPPTNPTHYLYRAEIVECDGTKATVFLAAQVKLSGPDIILRLNARRLNPIDELISFHVYFGDIELVVR